MPTVRFQLRRDTAANWASVNPTLGPGEPALESNTRRQKIGDGATPWNSLPYVPDGTVKSVNASGGSTGLTFSGGPITDTGSLTLGGTLSLANGGTGAPTQAGARTSLGLGTAAVENIGTTGATVPLLSASNTFAGTQTFNNVTSSILSNAGQAFIGALQIAYNGAVAINGATNPGLSQHSTGSSGSQWAVGNWAASTGGPRIALAKSRGGAVGTHAAVQANDTLGYVEAQASDGTQFQIGGQLRFLATETWGASFGTELRITLVANGGTTVADVARFSATSGLQMFGANVVVDANRILRNRTYTVSTAASPTGIAGAQIYISNPTSGQARPYWSNGTEWRDATGTLLA